MATETQQPLPFWEEKISIEPDLGDQRRSTYKALPSPPKTPKRVMMKYRFSGVFPLVLSLAAFVLTLVMVLAGGNVTTFEGQYLVAVCASPVQIVGNADMNSWILRDLDKISVYGRRLVEGQQRHQFPPLPPFQQARASSTRPMSGTSTTCTLGISALDPLLEETVAMRVMSRWMIVAVGKRYETVSQF